MSKTTQLTIVIAHNTAKYLLLHYRHLLKELSVDYDRIVCVTPKDGHEHEFGKLGYEHRSIDMEQHGMNPLRELLLVKEFLSIYQEYQPDRVLNFSIKPCLYGGYAAKKTNVPKAGYVITGLGYVFMGSGLKVTLLKKLIIKIYKKNLRVDDDVFFQNKDDAQLFSDLGITELANTYVLPGTGIDLDEFKPSGVREQSIDKVRFLFIGRMLKDKGIHELVKACYSLRKKGVSFQCDLLGPLDENPSAISLSELKDWQKKKLIHYLGEVHDVKPVIEKSHVFVLPSYREGLPRAGLEAMAMGLPVITTDVPGCREIIEHKKNGFMITAEHSTPLVKAMKRFVDDKSLIKSMGNRSRLICEEKFSVDIVSEIIRNALLEKS